MKKIKHPLLPLFCALPIAALFSSPASAVRVGGDWTGGFCNLVTFPDPKFMPGQPPVGMAPTGIGFTFCKNKTNKKATDLHLTFKITDKNNVIQTRSINQFFPEKPVSPRKKYKTPPIQIWTINELIGFGFPAMPGANQIFLDNQSFWTEGGIDAANPGTTIPNPPSPCIKKQSKSNFALAILNPITNFLMPPAYAQSVPTCAIPEPNQSLGVIVGGVTLLLLGIKRA